MIRSGSRPSDTPLFGAGTMASQNFFRFWPCNEKYNRVLIVLISTNCDGIGPNLVSIANTVIDEPLLDIGYLVDEAVVTFPCLVIVVFSRTKRMNAIQELAEYTVIT